jgi:hypothetical protein
MRLRILKFCALDDRRRIYSFRSAVVGCENMWLVLFTCLKSSVFRRVHKIAKSDYWLRHVGPHGTTRLPLHVFS